jgi:hypothetical protein
MGMVTRTDNTTKFLNVDLDIFAKFDLQPLAAALGRKVNVLYAGRERGLYSTHLELNVQPKTADAVIRGFVVLIRGLPGRSESCGMRRKSATSTSEFGQQPETNPMN